MFSAFLPFQTRYEYFPKVGEEFMWDQSTDCNIDSHRALDLRRTRRTASGATGQKRIRASNSRGQPNNRPPV